MRRLLCVRFPNWSIQRLRRRLMSQGSDVSAVALHSKAPGSTDDSKTMSDDLRYVRGMYPAAIAGPAIIAVSTDAWKLGIRPGIPLAEARSMAIPSAATRSGKTNSARVRKSESASSKQDRVPANSTSDDRSVSAESSVGFYDWEPTGDREALAATAELARRYAPIVGLDAMPVPDSLLLDITGCAPLFGGEAALAELLLRDLHTTGWSCRIAIASNIATAWALTHVERAAEPIRPRTRDHQRADRRSGLSARESPDHVLPIQIIPPGHEQSELKLLPIAAARIGRKDLEILQHLGIRSMGQLLSLPIEDLPSRLSEQSVMRVQQLLGIIDEFIDPLPEADPVAAAWAGEEPAVSLADHQHLLRILSQQIADQLQRRQVACTSISCEFRCMDGTLVPLTGSLVRPTQSGEMIQEVLCLRIETAIHEANIAAAGRPRVGNLDVEIHPQSGTLASLAIAGVRCVTMKATTVSIPSARQRDLFSPTEHIVPEQELARLIGKLSHRLGSESVSTIQMQPDPRPEFSFAQQPILREDPSSNPNARQVDLDQTLHHLTTQNSSEFQIGAICVPQRPLRLLETPLPLLTDDHANARATRPRMAIVDGQSESLVSFEGPERLQTGWWTDFPCHRDYYRVSTNSGSLLWIFRNLQTGTWFLHGIFD
ncbi:MAG: hypothetical protein ACK58L_18720 [Planctomycetota bacterium]